MRNHLLFIVVCTFALSSAQGHAQSVTPAPVSSVTPGTLPAPYPLPPNAPADGAPPTIDEVVADFAKEFSYRFKEFSRDVYVYHWNPGSNIIGGASRTPDTDVDIDKWAEDHIFGCNLKLHPEDDRPDPNQTKNPPVLKFEAKTPSWTNFPPFFEKASEPTSCPADDAAKALADPALKCLEAVRPVMDEIE